MVELDEKKVIVKMAYNYFQNERWDRALVEYEKLLAIDDKDFLARNMIAEIYIRKGQKKQAINVYKEAAEILEATDDLDRAIKIYNNILKLEPDDQENIEKLQSLINNRLVLAEELVNKQELEKALNICENLIEKLPGNEVVVKKIKELMQRIKSIENKNRPTEKRSSLESLSSKDIEVLKNLYALAQRCEKNKDWEKAIKAYSTILCFRPDDRRVQKRLDDLTRLLATKLKKNRNINNRVTGIKNTSVLLDNTKEKSLASAEEKESLLQEKTIEVDIILTQAQIHINQNLLNEALKLCLKVLEIEPNNKKVRVLLKQIYDKKKL